MTRIVTATIAGLAATLLATVPVGAASAAADSSTAGSSAVASASSAGVLASSCAGQPHRIHTTDSAPHAAVACWIDNGDKLRVCDTDPTDGVHAHAEIDESGRKIRSEDDGADAGCDDDAGSSDVDHGADLILTVCAQNASQQNSRCLRTAWTETE